MAHAADPLVAQGAGGVPGAEGRQLLVAAVAAVAGRGSRPAAGDKGKFKDEPDQHDSAGREARHGRELRRGGGGERQIVQDVHGEDAHGGRDVGVGDAEADEVPLGEPVGEAERGGALRRELRGKGRGVQAEEGSGGRHGSECGVVTAAKMGVSLNRP